MTSLSESTSRYKEGPSSFSQSGSSMNIPFLSFKTGTSDDLRHDLPLHYPADVVNPGEAVEVTRVVGYQGQTSTGSVSCDLNVGKANVQPRSLG